MATTGYDDRYDRITLRRWKGYWIAIDEERSISSSPVETRQEALDDLDENLALFEGALELSEGTKREIDDVEGQMESGRTISLEDYDTARHR